MKHLGKLWKSVKNKIHKKARAKAFAPVRAAFGNPNLSVFSSNCVGCMMLNDLGVQFRSPFVNLFVDARDYLSYLSDPHRYNAMTFEPVETDLGYPVGRLGDLTFHFVHYRSFEEAVEAFHRRAERIDYDNLYVIFSERDGCTYEDLVTFDALPYAHKVVFTHKEYPEIRSAVYLPGFEDLGEVGSLYAWDKKLGRRVYDRFDFANWFDSKK